MTLSEFVAWATGYYGPYPRGQREDVLAYLGDTYTPAELGTLKATMVARCPSHIGQVNGYPPDISRMEAIRPEVVAAIEAEARSAREREHAARLLPPPAPEPVRYADMASMDWATELRRRVESLAAAKRYP